MYFNIDNINLELLKKDLIDYFGSATFMVSPIALIELTKIENSTAEQLIQIAIDNKFDLRKYLN